MENLIGTTWPVFIVLTGILFGLGAVLMGQALARTWRPYWQVILYTVPLAAAARFFSYALFDSPLFTLLPYLINFAYLVSVGLLVFRLSRADQMVRQYPWLYERSGPFAWRNKA